MIEALLGFAVLFLLTLLRLPIAFAMGIVGVVGLAALRGWSPAVAGSAQTLYETGFSYALSVVPLFVLMGNLVTRSGMSKELFAAAYAFLGHLRGGLAMSAVLACGGFGTICGSSLATAATMSKVAFPSMRRFGYSDALAAGSIAAGGTLGILIPPSVVMVILGIMTETNIGALFAAGILPGLLGALLYLGAVLYTTARDPNAGPPGERTPWRGRLLALRGIASVVLLFILVIGGIYGGFFTATEAAGVGAAGAFLIALGRGALTFGVMYEVLVESARTTAMLFAILIGAMVFANFINFTSMPGDLREAVENLRLDPLLVVAAICLIYIALGCVLESISMILLTVPMFFPLVIGLGLDPVWFGVIIVVVTEISLITPPVGMNIFVMKVLLPDVSTATIFRGVTPFIVADVVRLVLLIAFPAIALTLPRLLF